MKKRKWIVLVCSFMLMGCSVLNPKKDEEEMKDPLPTEIPTVTDPAVEPHETEEPTAADLLDLVSYDSIHVIINKKHPLPEDYEPDDLIVPDVPAMKELTMRKEAADAMKIMFDAAKKDGIELAIGSGYRSYSYQKNLYQNYVARDGEEAANRYSAKPGQSEHQTGLAADLAALDGECYLQGCFMNTDEGKWLAEHAHEYGFILRYPEEKEEITGYIFEPWHYRYLGIEEALKIKESGLTLEEYYNYTE